eukprot:m.402392 g.402392  ORF g.402392 m.402392 type:complete len:196 (+) comp21178_c0_seq3:756-1343(+)
MRAVWKHTSGPSAHPHAGYWWNAVGGASATGFATNADRSTPSTPASRAHDLSITAPGHFHTPPQGTTRIAETMPNSAYARVTRTVRDGQSSQCSHRRENADQVEHGWAPLAPRRRQPRDVDHQRDVHDEVEVRFLLPFAVLAHVVAVVGVEQHDCVVLQPAGVEGLQDGPDVLIYVADGCVVRVALVPHDPVGHR